MSDTYGTCISITSTGLEWSLHYLYIYSSKPSMLRCRMVKKDNTIQDTKLRDSDCKMLMTLHNSEDKRYSVMA